MCWSFSASIAMTAVGGAAAVHARREKAPAAIWATLGYFALMEGLQAAGYLVADDCDAAANRLITALSYAHIVFQPFFINALAMNFVSRQIARHIQPVVYCLCAASTAFMAAQVYPFDWAGHCHVGQLMCGEQLCVHTGEWHIAWDIPYNGLARPFDEALGANWGFPTYVLTVVILPLLYGSWRFAIFHFFAGPLLANLLTSDINETPAIWCLFSIGIIVISIFPILQRGLLVERWFLWPKGWIDARA